MKQHFQKIIKKAAVVSTSTCLLLTILPSMLYAQEELLSEEIPVLMDENSFEEQNLLGEEEDSPAYFEGVEDLIEKDDQEPSTEGQEETTGDPSDQTEASEEEFDSEAEDSSDEEIPSEDPGSEETGEEADDTEEIAEEDKDTEEETPQQLTLERTLYVGLSGEDVLQVQQRLYELGYLTASPDGIYGNLTKAAVNDFQLAHGLATPDGMVGNWTIGKLNGNPLPKDQTGDPGEEDPKDQLMVLTRTLRVGLSGEDVLQVQQRLYELGYLTAAPDGIYGNKTRAAVIEFQLANGLSAPDGMVGNWTIGKLNGTPVSKDQASIQTDGEQGKTQLSYRRTLTVGMSGLDVLQVQQRLAELGYLDSTPDGIYGAKTRAAVMSFQRANGLKTPDGMVGNWTIGKLNSAAKRSVVPISLSRTLYKGLSGEDVRLVQQRLYDLGYLTVEPTNYYGELTAAAVKSFQYANGISNADGMVGQTTLARLNGNPKVYGTGIKVLFIGNSMTEYKKNLTMSATQYLRELSDINNANVEITEVIRMEAELIDFASGQYREDLADVMGNGRQYDIIFIQQISENASFETTDYKKQADALASVLKTTYGQKNAKIMLYATNGCTHVSGVTMETYTEGIIANAQLIDYLNDQISGVSEAGEAVLRYSVLTSPSTVLYDGNHPAPGGYFLSSLRIYESIVGKYPDTVYAYNSSTGKGIRQGLGASTSQLQQYLAIAKQTMTISKTSLSLIKGGTEQLSVNDPYNGSIKWRSTNTKAATVSSTGQVTAVGSGTAVIIATSSS